MLDKYTMLYAVIFLLSITTSGLAQSHEVNGTVTDAETGESLPGVNILIQGTSQGTTTDLDGEYQISADPDAVLVFSYVGYESLEIPIEGRAVIDVSLSQAALMGEELVVVGYGSQERRDITGSVATVNTNDFNQGMISSPEQLIQGKISGVQVVQNSGEPGAGMSINIRGAGSINANNSPLYVIDGHPVTNDAAVSGSGTSQFTQTRSPRNPLRSLNVEDIESITVLKDASAAAIYGSRGANGVVLIETKRGQAGSLVVNYDGSVGSQNVANKLDLLSPQEYRDVLNGIIDDGGGNPELRIDQISNGGTDWQNEIFKNNAITQKHNISFSGGNESTTYFLSLNYLDQQGAVINSQFERYGGRINLDHSTGKFDFGLNLSASASNDDFVANGFDLNERAGAINAAINYDPTISVRNENGEFNRAGSITIDNPVAIATGKDSWKDSYRVIGSVFGEYSFSSNLLFRLKAGGDVLSERRDTYIDRTTIDGGPSGGIATILDGSNVDYEIDATLNYQESFNEHDINALLGISTQKIVQNSASMKGESFPSDVTRTFNMGFADPSLVEINSNKVESRLQSTMGRINYSFRNTYLLTATMRIDGSSRFGENERYGYFPSFALGWNMHEEGFFEPLSNYLSTLKIRGSWGRTGNQEIGNYQSITTFGGGQPIAYDGVQVTTNDPTRLGNPGLKWETNEQRGVAIEFGLFENRINGEVEYFNRLTKDMLLALPVPQSTGFSSQLSNVGEIKNSGFEFSLDATLISSSDFNWNTNVSFSTLNNEVRDLGPIPRIVTGSAGFSGGIGLITEGEPLFSFFGYEVDGVWQQNDDFSQTTDNVSPGDIKFRDINGDGTITEEDRVILGSSFPDFQWSFGTNLNYKRFNLNFFFTGQEGVHMLNNTLAETYFPVNFRRNRLAEPLLNRWTPENPSNKFPSFVNPTSQGQKTVNSRTVEDASYIKLQNVTLTYNLPRLHEALRSASIYLTGTNLFTITDYSGFDPSINPAGNANFRIDWNAYPSTRTYIVGIRLGF